MLSHLVTQNKHNLTTATDTVVQDYPFLPFLDLLRNPLQWLCSIYFISAETGIIAIQYKRVFSHSQAK